MMPVSRGVMDQTNHPFPTYEEFWPHYLRMHSKRETRLLHFAGIFLGACSIIKGVFAFKVGWILIAPLIGYTFAWFAHVFIERNQPATFEYPLWSLRGDFQMLKLWLTGQLSDELIRNEIH